MERKANEEANREESKWRAILIVLHLIGHIESKGGVRDIIIYNYQNPSKYQNASKKSNIPKNPTMLIFLLPNCSIVADSFIIFEKIRLISPSLNFFD